MTMTIKDKGALLKALRLKAGMTQDEVGKIISVTKQTLFKYENGIITNIPSDKIELLAKTYNTTPSFIMGWKEENDQPKSDPQIHLTEAEQLHLNLYRQLTEENKNAVDDFINYHLSRQKEYMKKESISG